MTGVGKSGVQSMDVVREKFLIWKTPAFQFH